MRLIAILLALMMTVVSLSACGGKSENDGLDKESKKASTELEDNSLEFELSDDEKFYSVKGIGTYKGDVVEIPDEYKGKPVTAIVSYAFSGCEDITQVIIPESITSIDSYAFENCTALKEMVIPNSVEGMEGCIFIGCTSLEYVTLSENLKYINPCTFENCSSLKSIHIPAACESISPGAFSGCVSLETLTVAPENKRLTASGNCIIDMKEKMLELGCASSVIPTDSNLVTDIGQNSFLNNTNLKSIEIPENIKTIGGGAFKGTSLNNIVLPSRMKAVGDGAFEDCKSLKTVTIGPKVTYIAPEAFAGCDALSNVIFENTSGWRLSPDGSEGELIDVNDTQKTIEYLIASDVSHYLYCKD